jgi:small subunit ribosomal protein S16
MAVKIRLKKFGKKGSPHYRIVVADVRVPRDGRFIEEVGHFDPTKNPPLVGLKKDRVLHWLSVGAKPTERVKDIFKKEGIVL